MRGRWACVALVLWAALPQGGCARWYRESADREVGRLLDAYGRSHPRPPVSMEEAAEMPAAARMPLGERLPEPPAWAVPSAGAEAKILDLAAAEATAIAMNRDYLSRRETLYLTALALTGQKHRFEVLPAASVDARSMGGAAVDETMSHTSLAEVSKVLLYGGTVRVRGQQAAVHTVAHHDDPDSWSASMAVELTQPLLRDFGREVSHEAVIQAERDLIYDLRDFFQFRQDFAIDVAREYWSLQQQRERVGNQERSLRRLEELEKRAEARFEKGAAEAVDRFRAAREVLRARDDLNDERRAYALALDQFKIRLGLPVEAAIDVADDRPAFRALDPSLERAGRAALLNRVDLLNATERMADAQRRVRVARNALLASVDLVLRYESRTAPSERFDSQHWGDGETSVGMRLALPLDRTFERNDYRQALIALDRTRRAQSLAADQVLLDVRERIRELRRAEATVELQRASIEQLKREREMANILVERGEASNRDVVDAEARLLDAENRLVQAEVDHAVARLRFYRSIGTLEIDKEGMWQE